MSKKGLRFLLLIIGIFIFVNFVNSVTYYVSPTGDDANDGLTDSTPKLTLSYLVNSTGVAASGSTIIIMPGTNYANLTAIGSMYFTRSYNIIGQSRESSILKSGVGASSRLINFEGVSLNISNLTIDSTGATNAIELRRSAGSQITLEDVNIINAIRGVYYATTGFGDLNLTNVYFNATTTGINAVNADDGTLTMKDVVFNNDESSAKYIYSKTITPSNIDRNLSNVSLQKQIFYDDSVHFLSSGINLQKIVKLYFSDVDLNNEFNISNLRITNFSTTADSNLLMYFTGVNNTRIENISIGNSTSPLYGKQSFITIDSNSNNISLENISIYVNSSKTAFDIIGGSGNNLNLTNISIIATEMNTSNIVNGIFFSGNNINFLNINVSFDKKVSSYLAGIGSEARVSGVGWYENSSIQNATISITNNSAGAQSTHSVFIGYTKNPILSNITVSGGYYCFVIKGNINGNYTQLSCNASTRDGIYLKAGYNSTFNYFNISNVINGLNIGNTSEDYVNNITFFNGNVSSNAIQIDTNSTEVYFKDVVHDLDENNVSDTSNLYVYYSINVSGQSDTTFSLTDNQNNTYGSYNTNTYEKTYFLFKYFNSSGNVSYSPYNYSATKYGYSQTGNFVLTVYYLLSLPDFILSQSTTNGGSTGLGTYRPSENSLQNGWSVRVVKGQKVQIPIGELGESKNIEIKSIGEGKVVVSVGGKDYEISSSEKGKIDLDSDGFYDVEINNKETSESYADLEFKLIHEEVPSEQEEKKEENILDKIPEVVKKFDWKVYVLIGVVIILIIVWIVLKRKNRK